MPPSTVPAAAALHSAAGRRAVLSVGLLAVGTTACTLPFPRRRQVGVDGLFDYALSPDGRTMAVLQSDFWMSNGERRRIWRLILYRWPSREITVVPLPEQRSFRGVQFSPDGRKVAMVRSWLGDTRSQSPAGRCDVVLMDLQDQKIQEIAVGFRYVWSLRFSPEGSSVAFISESYSYGSEVTVQPLSGQPSISRFLNTSEFYGVNLAGFKQADELILTALKVSGQLGLEAEELGYTRYGRFTLSMWIQADRMTPPQAMRPQPDDRWPGAEPGGLSLSRDGAVLAWTGRTEAAPKGRYAYDAFERRNGKIQRLTELNTFVSGCSISGDGSVVAFAESPDQTRTFDLTVVETHSRRFERTGLLSKLRRIPPSPDVVRMEVQS